VEVGHLLGIELVAAHMAGDYLFQSSHMAANKLSDWRVRLWHCAVYTLCFAPVALLHASPGRSAAFLGLLFAAHFATDSKRWRTSNPWPAMPILQDQSLHAVQIAVLAHLL
jgi:hypothetical protein